MERDNSELLQKFQKIIKMSSRVDLSRVAEALGLSEKDLFVKLMDWNERIPFKIEKGEIVVEDSARFVEAIDRQFAAWEVRRRRRKERWTRTSKASRSRVPGPFRTGGRSIAEAEAGLESQEFR